MALLDNLVSYWKLDETSGTREDAHSTNDLTDNNTVLSATGVISNGADFESSNSEFLSIADGAQSGLGLTTDFSFSLWIKPESIGAQRGLISKWAGAATDRSYSLTVRADNKLEVSINGNATATSDATVVTDAAVITSTSVFYHIVVAFDISASDATIYVNGVEAASTASGSATAIETGAGSFRIGDVQDNSLFFDGIIDEVGVWSRLLTADEVTQLYDSGAGNPYPFRIPINSADVAGAPVEAVSFQFQLSAAEVAGAPVELARGKVGYSNADKSAAPSWTNTDKS